MSVIIVPETLNLFSYCFSRAEFHVCEDALSDLLCMPSEFVIVIRYDKAIVHIATVTSDTVLY